MQQLLGAVVFAILVAVGLIGLQAGGAIPQAIIILLSAGVGLGVWKAQRNAERAEELESKLGSDQKVLYKLYLDLLREMVETDAKADTRTAEEVLKKLRAFVFNALLIASDEVVLAHNRFLHSHRVSEEMVLPAIADVILAMRRDAGQAASRLQQIDILATFIKAEDIEKVRPLCDQWAVEKANAWPVPPQPAEAANPRA